jgi:hypothetical protein
MRLQQRSMQRRRRRRPPQGSRPRLADTQQQLLDLLRHIPFWGPPPQLSQPPRLPQRPTQLLPGHAFSEFLSPEGEEASGAIPTALALLPFSHDHPGQWVG